MEDLDSFEQSTRDEEIFASGKEVFNLAVGDAWLKTCRTLGRDLDNDSASPEDATIDQSFLAIAVLDDADSTEQSTTYEDFFLSSSLEISDSDLAVDNAWLKTSRTPGRNLDNDSVLPKDASIDPSFFAIAFPLVDATLSNNQRVTTFSFLRVRRFLTPSLLSTINPCYLTKLLSITRSCPLYILWWSTQSVPKSPRTMRTCSSTMTLSYLETCLALLTRLTMH